MIEPAGLLDPVGPAEDPQPERNIMVVSNRGPVSFSQDEEGNLQIQRSGGGLVTALTGMAQNAEISWVAAALNDLENSWENGPISLGEGQPSLNLHLVPLSKEVYEGYYNVIANPLLWFLQHSMWNFITSPNITRATWDAWEQGYVEANRSFATVIAQKLRASKNPVLVMLQDYHLYLVPTHVAYAATPPPQLHLNLLCAHSLARFGGMGLPASWHAPANFGRADSG